MVRAMTSEESWRRVKRVLKDTFELNDARIVWLGGVREELRRLASGGIPTAPDFTLHNEVHSDNVVLLLSQLAEHLDPELTEYEGYLVTAAAYLHDVGMFIGRSRFKAEILPDLAGTLRFCEEDICDSGARYEDAVAGKSIDAQIRAVHHLLSAYLIDEEGGKVFHLHAPDRPHVIAICRGHRKANLRSHQCTCYENKPEKYGLVRRGLLAGLIRLADGLDLYRERAPEETFRTRAWDFLEKPIALKHWLNHCFARSVYVTIGDRGGNPYLNCQISYSVPARKTLNGLTYKEFLTPLLDEFMTEAGHSDFDIEQYPAAFREALGVRDIEVNWEIEAEAGAVQLPDRIIQEIERSGCGDILEFLSYLESGEAQEPTTWEAPPVMDRRPELETFKCMLDGDDPEHRLVLMVGSHGQGKTWLMETFESVAMEREVACLRMDLSDGIGFDDILDGIWRLVGARFFPIYSARRERLAELNQRAPDKRREELTRCFFIDWSSIDSGHPLVVLLDTYERASQVLQDWISTAFLKGIIDIDHVIAVIGGREWPEVNGYWRIHGHAFPLSGVRLRDYERYAAQRGAQISRPEIVQLHRDMAGLPKLFVEYLDAREQMGV